MLPRRSIRLFARLFAFGAVVVFVLFLISHKNHTKALDDGIAWVKDVTVIRNIMNRNGDFWERSRSTRKVDWLDHKLVARESQQKGPGENGAAHYLSPKDDNAKDALYKTNGFNALVSDYIALNRSVKDIRHHDCRTKTYFEDLPTASIVVPFHNEHLSVLLRTAISALNRAPPNLLEVILVDDASTKEETRKPLDDYVRAHLPRVRVVHLSDRSGLIRARMAGARRAKGDVIIFLDSHTEANVNWLPPLLDPIAADYRTVVCPFIDVIDYETFAYRAQDEGARGAFDWEFYYKRLPLLPQDLLHPAEPFKSPVMAGGLFAISKKFFFELGGYDEGLEIWGGEQYELSFKIWQCGGLMVDAPCSRIGHIYRKFAPFPNSAKGDFVGRNYKRVAEVWMDEYAEYLYKRKPHWRDLDAGDLTEQKAIREKLQCKPFKWFMKNIAFDLPKKYPPVEPEDFAWGEVRSKADTTLCVDTQFKKENERFNLEPCVADGVFRSGEQNFALTWHKDIRPGKRTMCWDVSSSDSRAPVLLWGCHGGQGNQLWRYDPVSEHLIHGGNPRCLDHDPERKELFVARCDGSSPTQRWTFQHFNETALSNWDRLGVGADE